MKSADSMNGEASNLSAISLLAEVMNHIAVSACPPTERLNDLLDEQLLAAERDALEDHLATCPHCQQALLTASGDATQWDRLKPHLQSRTSDDHTPAEMLSSLKGTAPSVRRGLSKSGGSAPPVVPGYEILGELGRGGMAVVYRARQLALGREVALKVVLAGDHAAPELRARFRREAEAVARLRHPGVVQVYDVGEHNGLPYFSMELVEGGTLKDRLRAGSPDPRETAALVEAVARSVHTAHSAGVVHRDLKPANILLGPEPKIADFGLALDRDAGENGWTQTGDVLGTPAYMAPEQAQGRRADVGPCTDIHALGVILYEALTGRTPFAAEDNVRTLVQVSFEEPLPPRRLRPGVPRDLETVCLKCLEKNPSLRYASALDLADDLRRFLAGEPIRARQASVAERLVKLARRYPLVASLMAVIVLVTTAGFVGVTVAMLDARGARDEESRQRGKAEDAGNRALAALDRSEQSVYFGIIAQARSQWLLNNVTASARLLDRCPLERRGWEWHYLRSLNHCDLLTVPETETPWVTGTAFSPDGKWVATSGGDPYAWPNSGVVQMLDATTGRVRWRKDALPHLVRNLAYSPDGRFLATAGGNWRDEEGGGKLRIWDAATGNVVRDFPGHDQETVYRVAFSPDGSRLATTSHQRATRVWDVSTGNEVYQTEKSELDSVAFTPDGRFLVFDGPNGITFREAATGTAVRVTPRVAGLFAISPEGARLATAHRDQLRVWDISVAPNGVSLSLVQAFNGHEGTITDLAFRPDGQGVVTAGSDGTVRVWELARDAEPLVFRGHPGRVGAVAFHPDGRSVVSGGKPPGDIRVWDATRKPECVTAVSFSRERRDVAALAFTSDGRELLALADGGTLRRWDCVTGQSTEHGIGVSAGWVVPGAKAAFSADGRIVVAVKGERDQPNTVRVAVVATEQEVAVLSGHLGEVRFVACDSTGERVVTGGTGTRDGKPVREIRVWDTRRGAVVYEESISGEHCDGVAISLDGTQLLDARRGSDTSVVLTDLSGGTPPKRFVLPGSVSALAFSPRGSYFAAAGGNGAIHVLDRNGKLIHDRPLPGPAALGWLAFSPDETRLAGVTRERVQVWDVASGQDVLFLRGAGPRPYDNAFNPRVAWSHDGTKLAASNWDRTVSVWDSADTTSATGKAVLRSRASARIFEWHRELTEASARPEAAFAAAFHRDRALAVDMVTPFQVRQRGDFLARLGRLKEARAVYAGLFANGIPNSPEVCEEYAALLVATGDNAAYQELRRAALWRWVGSSEREVLNPLIRFGSVLPASPVDAALLLVAARRHREAVPTERSPRATLAIALTRAGDSTPAIEELRVALDGAPAGDWIHPAQAWRTLAAGQLGHDAEVEANLKLVDEWLASRALRLPPAVPIMPAEWGWVLDLEVRVLRKEVQLLRGAQRK